MGEFRPEVSVRIFGGQTIDNGSNNPEFYHLPQPANLVTAGPSQIHYESAKARPLTDFSFIAGTVCPVTISSMSIATRRHHGAGSL
jgi:hypothetical protein